MSNQNLTKQNATTPDKSYRIIAILIALASVVAFFLPLKVWTNGAVANKALFGIIAEMSKSNYKMYGVLPILGNSVSALNRLSSYVSYAFIFALVAVGGTLYRQHALTFCASVLCLVMGLLGMVCWASLEENGVELDGDQLKELVEFGKTLGAKISVVRWGAILYFVCALVTAAGSFMAATGCKLGECKK
jgi:hypothetical protein